MNSKQPHWWPNLIQTIRDAQNLGVDNLVEYQVYQLLQQIDVAVPHYVFVEAHDVDAYQADLSGAQVVVKIVDPTILHKSDVGGVRLVANNQDEICSVMNNMLVDVEKNSAHKTHLQGCLVCEKVEYAKDLGNELIISLRNNAAFGPVIYFGVGGTETELIGKTIERPLSILSVYHITKESIVETLQQHWIAPKLQGYRGQDSIVSLDALANVILKLASIGEAFDTWGKQENLELVELELNPIIVSNEKLIPLDGLLRFKTAIQDDVPARPIEQIDALLNPKQLAIIGVSEKMNMGRIILRNILKNGYDPQQVAIIKPGVDTIDDCRCYDNLAAVPTMIDMLVVAVAAHQVPALAEEIEKTKKVRAALLIPGGLGEKVGSESLATQIIDSIKRSRAVGDSALYNGGNSLGIISKPAHLDTMFIPPAKLPPNDGPKENVALISQSGAFMISRMSKQASLVPRYAISLGNQIDLTLSDYLQYMINDQGTQVIACYIEGFKPGDGAIFARAVSQAKKAGKDVVVYKAGRTAAGQASSAGHTASMAGDYDTAAVLLEKSGAWVCKTFGEFEDAIKLLSFFDGKRAQGTDFGAMSNAGFETVGIADNTGTISLATLSAACHEKVNKSLAKAKIDALVDVRNPIDITPMATDEIYADCAQALLEEDAVHTIIVAIVPLTPAMKTLPAYEGSKEDCSAEDALPARIRKLAEQYDKPVMVTIDSGSIYDPYAIEFEKAAIPVFREADRGMHIMARYVSYCLS